MNKTNIEYLKYSWNPTHGCSPIGEGCKNCWARVMSKRLAGIGITGYSKDNPFKVVCCPEKINEPLHIRKPSRIGVSFMGDLFHKDISSDQIREIYEIMAKCKQHTFIVLTKRPERIVNVLYDEPPYYLGGGDYLANVWHLTTVENQLVANTQINDLIELKQSGCGAWIIGLSVEPMLEQIDIRQYIDQIDWVICGCESGQNRRPTRLEWIIDLKNQCVDAGVPFFLKQMDVGGKVVKMPMLDGKVWDECPKQGK